MKTNHQRGFRARRSPGNVFAKYFAFSATRKNPLSDTAVGALATSGDHTNGKRGIAKDRKGAKKFINSRSRFHENEATRRLALDRDA